MKHENKAKPYNLLGTMDNNKLAAFDIFLGSGRGTYRNTCQSYTFKPN